MAELKFRSSKELREFKEYKNQIKKHITLEPCFISEMIAVNRLLLRFFRNSTNGHKVEKRKKIAGKIIEKFLMATSELHYLKENKKDALFSSKVNALYKSVLKNPKLCNMGRRKTIQLTDEELFFIHGPLKK